ncbi:MAG TPA: choline dehydrogenase [Acidimicrobiaceae bacterium]|jgi:choline dehydrogenase|nr:choline dehydrogenase [Acidimicrobiaceae bacterium]
MSDRYDFVIVGGGSAGCAMANRLSADPSNRVLVLEAGRRDWKVDVVIHMPAALSMGIGNRFYDWMYESEPEPEMGGRRVYHARGKVLGGSSSINGMIFQRGNPMDYDRWAATPGCEAWDWAHCLPYFKRMETCIAGADDWRGGDGPLKLERGPATSPLFQAFFEAVQQAGHPMTSDVNGYRQEGFNAFDRNVYRGRRLSAARAYLHPVLHRKNLDLWTKAHATRLVMDGTRVTGVEVSHRGRNRTVEAAEVVSCSGAINTPQLLQLSGIGPAGVLRDAGVTPVVDLPGVGENLQDHLEVYVQYACNEPVSLAPQLAQWRKPWIGLQWLFRKGPGASNHFEAGGFLRSNDDVPWPNLMFHFLPIAIRYDGSVSTEGHGYQFHIGPMFSNSRGWVRIQSDDPFQKPRMLFNYLSTPEDRQEWAEAIEVARNIMGQPAFERYNGGEISPGPDVAGDEAVLEWVRADAETALHPSCTARMGTDAMGVVDPTTMRVHGTQGLRVVDASVMPTLTNGNIYAPVMMIAEKAADLVLGNTPLPASDAPQYRHGVSEPDW